MKKTLKRLFAFLLTLLMLASALPSAFAQEQEPQAEVLTEADYAETDDVFAQINEAEVTQYKNATQTEKTDAAEAIVRASANYVEGSLERNGNAFTWWTDEGIRCTYNPLMRQKYANMDAPANTEVGGIYNEPATKGGSPTGKQVYLIGPYYGIDDDFTDQYKNEAAAAAAAIGDTDGYTLYSGNAATIDKVAEAVSNGAIVIFDSHGTTDGEVEAVFSAPNGTIVYDYVSTANNSYLCLTTTTGITTADYNAGAMYFTDYNGPCMCVNGAVIANHMTKNSPSGILWMAMDLGMATDTLCVPLRNKGVEVVCGYSEPISSIGNNLFEEHFWKAMYKGSTVAQAVAAMKSTLGNWDFSSEMFAYYYGSCDALSECYPTLATAQMYYKAFPIVVSDEDAHPGQRNGDSSYGADNLQTVKSTYKLFNSSQYNGWQQIAGKWYYYQNGKMVTGWITYGGDKYYLDSTGKMVTGWKEIDGHYYYFRGNSGKLYYGWLEYGEDTYYLDSTGKMTTGWKNIDGSRYFFRANSGKLYRGWLKYGNSWYYLNSSGIMQTGWIKQGSVWYYLNSSGVMQTGWIKQGSVWYYLNSSGVMQTGWVKVGGTWYYLKADGAMFTGWLKSGNSWYYLKSSGAMATGSLKIGSKTYYFNSSGVCLNP